MEGKTTTDIRISNRRRMVNLLFHEGGMTRSVLARRLDISLPTALMLLKELVEKGLVVTGDVMTSNGGRPPAIIDPVYDFRYAVGVDVSASEIRMVLQDLGSYVTAKASWPFGMQLDQKYWENVNDLLESFIEENVRDKSRLLDIGMSVDVPIDHGKVVRRKKDAGSLDLELIKHCISRPVEIQNSARMAATANIWKGKGKTDFVFLNLGDTVSGALVCRSEVWEFNSPYGLFGSLIDKGRRLDDVLTTRALLKKAGVSSLEELFEAIGNDEENCLSVWNNYLDVLGRVLYSLRRIFGYEVVIGGELSPYLDPYQIILRNRLEAQEEYEGITTPYFSISELDEYQAAMGAAMMPINRFLNYGFEEVRPS